LRLASCSPKAFRSTTCIPHTEPASRLDAPHPTEAEPSACVKRSGLTDHRDRFSPSRETVKRTRRPPLQDPDPTSAEAAVARASDAVPEPMPHHIAVLSRCKSVHCSWRTRPNAVDVLTVPTPLDAETPSWVETSDCGQASRPGPKRLRIRLPGSAFASPPLPLFRPLPSQGAAVRAVCTARSTQQVHTSRAVGCSSGPAHPATLLPATRGLPSRPALTVRTGALSLRTFTAPLPMPLARTPLPRRKRLKTVPASRADRSPCGRPKLDRTSLDTVSRARRPSSHRFLRSHHDLAAVITPSALHPLHCSTPPRAVP
jgi:hypothetical protein